MAVTAGLAVLGLVCSLLAWRYQQDLEGASRYNGTFDLSQGVTELMRLQMAVADSREEGRPSQLALRYSILRNRIGIISADATRKGDERIDLLERLKAALDRIGPNLERISRGEEIDTSIDLLRPFVGQLLQAASRSHVANGDAVMQRQHQLRAMMLIICGITLALVLFGALLVARTLRQYGRLDRVARTDALTGLLNRLAFNLMLRAPGHRQRAIVLVDVDHFKAVNDSLGHEAGDRLLRTLAERLLAASQGAATVARIGGDEFAILFRGANAAEESVAFAARVRDAMRQPILIDGREIAAGVTQGVRIGDDADGLALFNDADIALYATKNAGRGGFQVFQPSMKEDFLRRQKLLDDMRRMWSGDSFSLVYQPIVDLKEADRPRGVEALLRWQHPEFGAVSPTEFIPLAEESGLIQELGQRVVAEACRQAALWPDTMFVAVNVSARQLMNATLVDHVASCLAANGIAGSRLEIEITESTLIENDRGAIEVLERLRALGCRISLDDFGTGYASLSYLRRFRFDKLKIDKSFVLGRDGEDVAIVSTICLLADRLGLTVVAEGIETLEQREAARLSGSHLGQGYLFSLPISASAVGDLLRGALLPHGEEDVLRLAGAA